MLEGSLDLLTNTQDAAFIVDSEQRIVTWSKAAEEIFGWKPKEAIGRYCFELLEGNPACNGTCYKDCSVVELTRQNLAFPTSIRLVRSKDHDAHWLRITHIGITLTAKRIQAIIVLVNDVSEHMRHRELLDQLAAYAKEHLDRSSSIREDLLPRAPKPQLTGREVEVLRMLAEGGNTQEIAVRMGIQISTVRNHIQKTLEKLGVHTRLEAVLVGIKQKLVDP